MLKSIGVTRAVILIILAICIVPVISVWVLNSISESGGGQASDWSTNLGITFL